MTNSPTNAPPLTPALHAQTPGSIDKQIEVLIVCYPQNDFLHPKGAINLSLDSKAKEKRMAQCSHVISKIKRLKTKQMFDHIVVVNRRHYWFKLQRIDPLHLQPIRVHDNHAGKLRLWSMGQ